MGFKKHFIYLTAAVFALASCKKSNPAAVQTNTGPAIYVAGYTYVQNGGANTIALYWKNGVAQPLTSNSVSSVAADMVLNGTDVYIAGTSNISYINGATYWKNGVPVTFGYNNGAQSIAVAGNNVYVAYTTASAEGWGQPYYWENGVFTALTDGKADAEAESMLVNGTDVYVTGYTSPYGGPSATYWKNGTAVSLENNNVQASVAHGITMQGADLYISGDIQIQTGREAVYWKNGTRVVLGADPQDASAFAIAVQGNDVYVAGYLNEKAVYWKNGVPTTLGNGALFSVAISGSDVYFAGTDNGLACYWKNGTEVKLTAGPVYTGASRAVKIVVAPN